MANEKNKKVNKVKKEKRQDVPNQGHRHLFGSTEKSDFILNMDGDGAQKMCSRYAVLSMIIITIMAVPAYFTQRVGEYMVGDTYHYFGENFVFYSAAMVMLSGGVGYLVFNIARQKGNVDIKHNRLLILPVVIILLALVSCFCAESIHDAVLGYIGRHDGLLTLFGCFGLFAVAAAISDEKRKAAVADFIVGLGAFHSLVGILQAAPATSDFMHNYFEYLYIRPGTANTVGSGELFLEQDGPIMQGIYEHGRAASGFLTSPHALAALISVAFAVALAGAAFGGSRKRKSLYSGAAVLMAAAGCLTRVISAQIALGVSSGIILVLALIKAFKKENGSKAALVGLVPIVFSGIVVGIMLGTGTAESKDEAVIFTDSFIVRSIGRNQRYEYEAGQEDYGSDERSIYAYLEADGEYVISQKPLLGTGPDNFSYHLSEYSLTLDRVYNEYLDIAAQRGVPGLVLHLMFVLICLIKAIKAAVRYIKGEGDWLAAASLGAMCAYLAQAWFNTTWAFSTYYFYIAAGLAWGFEIMGRKKAEKR